MFKADHETRDLYVRWGKRKPMSNVLVKTTGLAKPKRVKSSAYLEWIREQPCSVLDGCNGEIHAHHLKTKGSGGTDYCAVPLCALHHGLFHQMGAHSFDDAHGTTLWRDAFDHLHTWMQIKGSL